MGKVDKYNRCKDPYELAEERGWVGTDDMASNGDKFFWWAYGKIYTGELKWGK